PRDFDDDVVGVDVSELRDNCRAAIALPIAYPMIPPITVSDAQCSPSAMRPTPIAAEYMYGRASATPNENRWPRYEAQAMEFAMWPLKNECHNHPPDSGTEITNGSAVILGRPRPTA